MLITTAFKQAVKKYRHDHNKRVLDDLDRALDLINTQTIGTQMDNHELTDANGLWDIHLDGGNFILLYKYINKDTVEISAKLHNVVPHRDLHKRGVYDERPAKTYDYEDVKKLIRGSSEIYAGISRDEIEDWVHDFYNHIIAPILLLDDIYITSLKYNGDYIRCNIVGTQYRELVSVDDLGYIKSDLRQALRDNSINYFDMYYYDDTNTYPDEEDAYDIELVFDIPIEEYIPEEIT